MISIVTASAITVVVVIVLLVASLSAGRRLTTFGGRDPVTIEVTGHQWWWEIHYDAPTPAERFITANEIHVPVGRPVLLKLSSTDVIHSFWVPSLHGKTDLVPGHPQTTWLQADRPGVFRGQCAEFCGLQHAHMALFVIAESPEAFETWQRAQRQPAPEPADPLAQRGRDVVVSGPCALCHTVRGTTAAARVAPDLTHLASRTRIAAGTLPNTPGHLAGWIVNSQSIKPGNRMPAIGLGAEDLQAVLAYLGTLR